MSTAAPAQRNSTHVAIDDLVADPLRSLLPVVRLVPGWQDVTNEHVEVQQLSGAMTNLVYRATVKGMEGEETKEAIVRVFGGSEGLFDRESERAIFALVSSLGLGPKLLADFANGRVEEFWAGHSIDAAHMRQPWVGAAVASAMASFHWYGPALVDPEQAQTLWERVSSWLELVQDLWGSSYSGVHFAQLAEQLRRLQQVLGHFRPLYAFCHNDLQYGNMMLFYRHLEQTNNQSPGAATVVTRKRGTLLVRSNSNLSQLAARGASEISPSVKFIDYEYACFNHVAFDIANHWCEYAADYHTDNPHILNFDKFPDVQQQTTFTRAYVKKLVKLRRHHKVAKVDDSQLPSDLTAAAANHIHALQHSKSANQLISDNDAPSLRSSANLDSSRDTFARSASLAKVSLSSLAALVQDCRDDDDIDALAEELRCQALAYVPVSHLHWALWGLIQAKQSSVDFDFASYSQQRLQRFVATAQELLQQQDVLALQPSLAAC